MFDHLDVAARRDAFADLLAPAGLVLDDVAGLMVLVYRDPRRTWLRHLSRGCPLAGPDLADQTTAGMHRTSVLVGELLGAPRCPACADNDHVAATVRPGPRTSLAALVAGLVDVDRSLGALEAAAAVPVPAGAAAVDRWAALRQGAFAAAAVLCGLGPRELLPVGPPLSLVARTTAERHARAAALVDRVAAEVAGAGPGVCGDPGGGLSLVVCDTDWGADGRPAWGASWWVAPTVDRWLAATVAGTPAALAPTAACGRLRRAAAHHGVGLWHRPAPSPAALDVALHLAEGGLSGPALLDTATAVLA